MTREALRLVAEETLTILAEGGYRVSGHRVELRAELRAAVEGTRLFRAEAFPLELPAGRGRPVVTVTGETTGVAAARMAGDGPVCLLNFASAKKPGGGFLNGARAQEEDLARCSGLYPCLQPFAEFYAAGRRGNSLYSDAMLYSPRVPFFRDDRLALLEQLFLASVITSPAPNASTLERWQLPDDGRSPGEVLRACLRQRAARILQLAAERGERRLVLGAWGCGVFRNWPPDVAEAFELAIAALPGWFDEIVFAVYDTSPERANYHTFRQRFEPG